MNDKLSDTRKVTLTKKEASVFLLQANGCNIEFISNELLISKLKVRWITNEVFRKLEIDNVKVLDKIM
ncbi:MAG: hypothetical protein EOP55_15725 [Sphingobacteriales bacterium]|nr:MAG: hypothetical protein EOP55_15725 [Sphingobacteriales bacterium]